MRVETSIQYLLPNPFRRIENYPIQEEKVAELLRSIESTGFWNNLVGRYADNGEDIEIAYGHHRLEALRRYAAKHGTTPTINIEVRDLSDRKMLRIMARENMEEWGHAAWVELETVRATVEAYAEGRIELDDPRGPGVKKSYLRWAPSFTKGELRDSSHAAPYTATTIADFLGWLEPSGQPQTKIKYALGALELVERGVMDEGDVKGLSTTELRELVTQVRRKWKQRKDAAARQKERAQQAKERAQQAKDERERAAAQQESAEAERSAASYERQAQNSAKRTAKNLGDRMRDGDIGAKQAKGEADKIAPDWIAPDKGNGEREEVVQARKIITTINTKIGNTLAQGMKLREQLDDVMRLAREGHVPPNLRDEVVQTLRETASRLEWLADEFEDEHTPFEIIAS